jgi:hypothetical protein
MARACCAPGYSINSVREDGGTFSVWGGNQGRTVTLNVDPAGFPTVFGAPGSVLFRNNLPARVAPTDPTFPLAVASGNSVSDFDPNLKNRLRAELEFRFSSASSPRTPSSKSATWATTAPAYGEISI